MQKRKSASVSRPPYGLDALHPLTFSFGYIAMGTASLPLPVALQVWMIAAATGIGDFSTFFEHGRELGHMPAALGRLRVERFVLSAWMFAAIGLSFLTFNSGMAVYHSKGGDVMVTFVANSYLDLVLLCGCLWLYERVGPGSPWRNRLKASVWTLSTLLTFSFGYIAMGTASLPLPVALQAWMIAAATGIGAFSTFFDHGRINQMPDATVLPRAPV